VEKRKTTFCGLLLARRAGSQSHMSDKFPYAEIGQRLEAVRKGFSDFKQNAWAEKHGFAATQYNNWETGARRIPVDDAEKLCATYGLTLDWIYRGRRDGLSDTASKVL
jgi:transcriptional regulator with XRE-family HTH domain